MSAPERPHCLKPEACDSTTARHCRRCGGVYAGRIRAATPGFREASRRHLIAVNKDPEARRKMLAAVRANPRAVANIAAAARRAGACQRADPDAEARRLAASRAAVPTQKARAAMRLADRARIPLVLVPEYRELRLAKLTLEQARETLLRAHPKAFAPIVAACRAESIRAAGPAPAIGSPQRATWTRKVNGSPNRETRPC